MDTVPRHEQNGNPSDIEWLRCPSCNRNLPATSHYFDRNPAMPRYGLRGGHVDRKEFFKATWYPECKDCRREKYIARKKSVKQRYYGQLENRQNRRASSANGRARLRHITGTHTGQQLREQYERQKHKCYYCGEKVAWDECHIDHVIPISRGGSNDISNLVITCSVCNLEKHNKFPWEFSKGGKLL